MANKEVLAARDRTGRKKSKFQPSKQFEKLTHIMCDIVTLLETIQIKTRSGSILDIREYYCEYSRLDREDMDMQQMGANEDEDASNESRAYGNFDRYFPKAATAEDRIKLKQFLDSAIQFK